MKQYFRLLPPIYMILLGGLTRVICVLFPVLVIDSGILSIIGWVVVFIGVVIELTSAGLFFKKKTTVNPHGTPEKLVITGLFKYSRNPMYIGQAMMLFGWGVIYGYSIIIIAVFLYIVLISLIFIKNEENKLQEIFGAQYTDYCSTVRRWL